MDRLLNSPLPIVAAPMAGGPTTVELSAAVAEAGGFPFLAAGYKSVEAVAAEIRDLEASTGTFGVNVFVPSEESPDPAAFRRYAEELRSEAGPYGLTLDPEPRADDDGWEAKLELLLSHPVPAVSFTFGLPAADRIVALRRAGTVVLGTVTTAEEAVAARDAGVDGLIVQGPGAGGHSATFDPARAIGSGSTEDLLRRVRAVVGLPLVAAGGVDGPAAVAGLLRAGAEAVAVGTLLLLADEAGTSATHRAALADPAFERTVITRAFTGRPARGLENGFIRRHEASAPLGYPAVHHLTRPLRQAAGAAGDAEQLHLWAGTGYRRARSGPAAEIIAGLSGAEG
ncbi:MULTISPECIES: nitronate monooxygenase [Arthrobacter]|uniref:Propionate 3-nitronate monooxygenase n=2 Tax=Arthrobacter TaxID=1663 RepID=A0ABU9KI38_9MICC|nr:nitronate monooxygenase [Arthrobacter sp. YJM1]MDP5226442.1 nitronate monooxygenase [Arthrobacter sp. YJM1]